MIATEALLLMQTLRRDAGSGCIGMNIRAPVRTRTLRMHASHPRRAATVVPPPHARAPRGVLMPRHSSPDRPETRSDATRIASRLAALVRAAWLYPAQWRCLLVGHDDQLAREPLRLFLRCAECGRCTRGWTIDGTPPLVTAGIAGRTHGRQPRARPSRLTDARPDLSRPTARAPRAATSVLFGTSPNIARA